MSGTNTKAKRRIFLETSRLPSSPIGPYTFIITYNYGGVYT